MEQKKLNLKKFSDANASKQGKINYRFSIEDMIKYIKIEKGKEVKYYDEDEYQKIKNSPPKRKLGRPIVHNKNTKIIE